MNQAEQQKELENLLLRAERAEKETARLKEEQADIQNQLAESKRTVKISDTMKGRFLANISHEIRTPMNGILGMTELLLNTELDESQEKFARSIAHSTESLLVVVNNLLDFSSMRHGKVALQDNLFFFDKLILEVCSQFEEKAAAKNIKLSCNIKNSQPAPVVGDEFRIRQILSNLVDNAIKFTDKGEVIVTEYSSQEDDTYGVTVRDSGQGISPQVQSDIFKSFSQGDNSSTRRFGGTGLGLTIANLLTKQMNGEIVMKSEVDKGSAFRFTCKLKAGDNDAINEIGKKELNGRKVLVVDDTETNLEILSLQLEQWDLNVECAESGKQALKMLNDAAAHNEPFELAILDLNMPNMDGLELAQHINNAEFSEDLRLMMLTSSVIELSDDELKQRGIVQSMLKPARQALLFAAVSRLLTTDRSSSDEPKAIAPDGKTRILLTEDDPINQEVATIMLESMGYEVVVADNGAAAVDALLHDNEFDLVLMDCQMPVMDGLSATRAIRDNNKNIPIVALTANANQEDKEQCIDAGMNDYLTKPIYRTDLSKVVHQWTFNSQPAKEASKADDANQAQHSENTMNIEIDESALDAIRALQRPGKPDILARIVNMYMEKSPELISAIKEGVAANDCDKVKMAAHTLKSSSAYVGASALAEVCNRIESKAANDNLPDTAEDITQVTSGFESVVGQIKQYA